jgi:alkanesulfonate monooxygenase SsuD/methylene tetrahydromethanopterin reductase-like flavin-dependent oxidoreductase (luciferase family)
VVTLATAAAVTERIRLGFGVMVVPLRHPAWVAKQVASLQHLSGNRVILGLGSGGRVHGMAGWEAVGVPFAAGGRRLDAALDVLLIADEPAPVDQRSRVTLAPGARVPPIWIGGGSDAALRRAVEHHAVWFPAMVPPFVVAQGARRLAALASECGRPVPAVAAGVVLAGVGTCRL